MKVLFVTPETHFISQPGGIGTYIANATEAITKGGGEVFIITWSTSTQAFSNNHRAPQGTNVKWLHVDPAELRSKHPGLTFTHALSEELAPVIDEAVGTFNPDCIEGTDYFAPLHGYLERIRAGVYRKRCRVFTFHHGLSRDVFKANGDWPSDLYTLHDFCLEENQLSWSDVVLCPSAHAMDKLRREGISAHRLRLLREPYSFKQRPAPSITTRNGIAHVGRFSYGKGADAFIYLLNLLEGTRYTPERIIVAGSVERSPFKHKDYLSHYLDRAPISLQSRTEFLGKYQRTDLLAILKDVRYAANLSRSETFGYTTVECIDAGLIPLVPQNTPMAEFIPPNLSNGLLPSPYPSQKQLIDCLQFWENEIELKLEELNNYCAQLLSPSSFVKTYQAILHEASPTQALGPAAPDSNPAVSVLISHRNDGKNLLRAVGSALNQTLAPREILIFDDGSSEPNSTSVLEKLSNYPNVRVFRSRHVGLCSARNFLIRECKTPWAVFLDSDDLLHDRFLEATYRAAIHAGVDAVIPRRQNFGENTNIVADATIATPYHVVFNNYRMTALINTSWLQRLPFDTSMRNGEADDWLFWLRFSLSGGKAITYPEGLFFYRFTSGTMSWPWSKGQSIRTTEGLIAALLRDEPTSREGKEQVMRGLEYYLLTSASRAVSSNILHSEQRKQILIRKVKKILRRGLGDIYTAVSRINHYRIERRRIRRQQRRGRLQF